MLLHWALEIVFLINVINEAGDPLHNGLGCAALFLIALPFV